MAFGVAVINLINSEYMSHNWSGQVPYDRSCSSDAFVSYRGVYYDSYFVTSCGMAVLCVLTVLFALLAGVNPKTEEGLIGFRLLNREKKVVKEN